MARQKKPPPRAVPELLCPISEISVLSEGGFPRGFSSAGDRGRRTFCCVFFAPSAGGHTKGKVRGI